MVIIMRWKKRTGNYAGLLSVTILSIMLTACGVQDGDTSKVNHTGQRELVSEESEYRDLHLAEFIIPETDSEDEGQELVLEDSDSTNTPAEEEPVSETDSGDSNPADKSAEEEQVTKKESKDGVQKPITETDSKDEIQIPVPNEDGSMEIYAAREIIPLSNDMLVGQVALEDILQGDPILYERIIIDRFVFEWILSDYKDEDNYNYGAEEGILIISNKDGTGDTQVIHTQGEGGGWGPPIMLKEHKFQYMDVNFDDVPDLLVCTGHHGNQGLVTYYCFLQTDAGFVESPTFTNIPNPAVDTENKLILGQWRNSAVSHSWAKYKYQDNAYVLYKELREDAEAPEGAKDASDYIWKWTVNGEVIGRTDELSESEIDDLIINENSEWRIADDRWRTIYNNGLNVDFSIYSDP